MLPGLAKTMYTKCYAKVKLTLIILHNLQTFPNKDKTVHRYAVRGGGDREREKMFCKL